ncbi:NADH dehydrogenase [Alicyclobacillus contaminans]|uniref:NAD(P)/FAD-dependent oxidoreductase n=1 Tax=Alicyclobacillus contaminans TaxID=392016 RepID=UPI000420266B
MSKILILGAGYAGMTTAVGLEKISEPFTLVNKHPYHYMATLLHEAAGGRGDAMNYTVPIRDVLRKPTSTIVEDEITGIDREKKQVQGKNGSYDYDYLVITLGWISEYFGIPGMAENSLSIMDVNSALNIRNHIEEEFKKYKEDGDKRHLTIVIGGAGLTGIELVGELVDWLPELCLKYGIDRNDVDLQNIEAMPTILPMVSEALRDVAAKTLTERGARLRTNTKLVKVDPGVVHLEGGEAVEAGTIVWTGGVRANPLLEKAGFTVDRRGRAKVNEFLQSVDDPHVFIGGDCAWFEVDGRPIPPTAQAAMQMGPVLADNVSAAIYGQPMKPFHFHNMGTLASLGREVGVGQVGGLPVRGVLAAMFKEGSKVKYLWQLGGARLTADKTTDIVHI